MPAPTDRADAKVPPSTMKEGLFYGKLASITLWIALSLQDLGFPIRFD